jgi:signal transduction histidine kinase
MPGIPRTIEDLIDDMQQYIGMLEVDEPRSEPNLARDLPFVIRQFVPAGIGTVLNLTAIGHDIGGRAAEDLLHIAREALSNAARHGRPSKIAVDVRRSKDEISLTIQDDGIGFDPATVRAGLGTTVMRTRTEGHASASAYPTCMAC